MDSQHEREPFPEAAGVMAIRLIALTGAESTGKTTLARALAGVLPARLVTEASRDLLAPGTDYGIEDVLAIAREQHRREMVALQATRGRVVADTDLLVIRIWLQERFQVWPSELAALWDRQSPRAWILTAPDIPWEPDPLRVNPHDRERLHGLYRQHLAGGQTPWIEVAGSVESRLQQARNFVAGLV